MPTKRIILLFLLFFFSKKVFTQTCPFLGARPTAAYPVCGNINHVVPNSEIPFLFFCSNMPVYVPACGVTHVYVDANPFWYKFTCYQSGTLGFLITPVDLTDDYDWQLFDITGLAPIAVYYNNTLAVASNWVATPGVTGASPSGSGPRFGCVSQPAENKPPISPMPQIIAGHNYLLLLSHADGTKATAFSLVAELPIFLTR